MTILFILAGALAWLVAVCFLGWVLDEYLPELRRPSKRSHDDDPSEPETWVMGYFEFW